MRMTCKYFFRVLRWGLLKQEVCKERRVMAIGADNLGKFRVVGGELGTKNSTLLGQAKELAIGEVLVVLWGSRQAQRGRE